MHLSSFCHPCKVIFTIKIMHDKLFIHSECSGQEIVFHIQSRTYITSKHEYQIYLRCLLEDLILLSILLDSISDRDRVPCSVLSKDLPSVLLTCSKRKAVEALSTARGERFASEAIKSLMGVYQSQSIILFGRCLPGWQESSRVPLQGNLHDLLPL